MTDPHQEPAAPPEVWNPNLRPDAAVALPAATVLSELRAAFGDRIDVAREASANRAPEECVARGAGWMRSTRMVGINVRTIGSFWRVVHYSLTLSRLYCSIHLLPIWEPGVVGSLYGMASWNLNQEFYDRELATVCPELDSAEKQLAFVVRLLHLQGRAVGMDMIPHTDRFSEMVLAEPYHFEWVRRAGTVIENHRASLHEEVMEEIDAFLQAEGPEEPFDASSVFAPEVSEATRLASLFGLPHEQEKRLHRRIRLIDRLYARGYETVPATMAPPYRGIDIDPDSSVRDHAGRTWYEYAITRPEPMSRVFGPLTRYKLYERLDDNAEWLIDFSRPRKKTFDYLARNVEELQSHYGFDFIRGDMSHVQMRPRGVPDDTDQWYDPFRYVCDRIRKKHPGFPYFAESFLAPPGTMAYGDELDHLEASRADVTLGDLQSVAVGDAEFLPRLATYLEIARTRDVKPSFTVMTGDKDDPRFDAFYANGNELRMFVSLLLPELPSYVALGYELRDPHPEPVVNEFYTKLYVFHESTGPKATNGPYRFGSNEALFGEIGRIRTYASSVAATWDPASVSWLLAPDPTLANRLISWSVDGADRSRIFVANTDTRARAHSVAVSPAPHGSVPRMEFWTPDNGPRPTVALSEDGQIVVRDLGPGQCAAIMVEEHD